MDEIHTQRMRHALRAARLAQKREEVPIGAAIFGPDGNLISYGHNAKEGLQDPTSHAEMMAIRRAAMATDGWRLDGCTLYSTLEPCAMCYGAIVQSRIASVFYGAPEPKFGVIESHAQLHHIPFNHHPEVQGGVLREECAQIIRSFFSLRRGRIEG